MQKVSVLLINDVIRKKHMPLLNWKGEYSVNVNEFDDQHRQLIGMINELHEAMAERKASSVLEGILAKLADYTVRHFTAEERLMRIHGYPGYEEHREKHQRMTAKVMALQDDLKRGKVTISLAVMDFLKNWLDRHILGTDKLYGPFFAGKGVG